MLNKDLDNVINLTEVVDDALDEKQGSKSLNLQEHLKEAKGLVKKINDEKKERERKKFEKALLEQQRLDKEIEEREKKIQEEKVLKE